MALKIIQFVNEPISSNCFLLFQKGNYNDCIIIDPGSEDENGLINKIDELNLRPIFIIITHEHFDHCWGVKALRDRFHAKVVCSEKCSERIQSNKKNLSLFYNQKGFSLNKADIALDGRLSWDWNDDKIEIVDTKGHTDSSISLLIGNSIFTGDALIKGQKTITKLLTGSKIEQKETDDFFRSLKGKHYKVYPGHGEIFDLDDYDI
jgi:hydroxyacylglutathione hydrolase